jgi:glucokinase
VTGSELALGIDLGGTNVRAGVVDGRGKILARGESSNEDYLGAEHVLDRIYFLAESVIEQAGIKSGHIKGVGLGTPGLADIEKGLVPWCPGKLPGWENLALGDWLEDRFGCISFIDNDVNVITRGEAWKGAAAGIKNFICMALGTGLGGGIVIDGRLLTGSKYSAANIGHIVVDAHGPLCMCGNRGCLETFVSGPAIAGRAISCILRGMESSIPDLVNGDLDRVDARIIAEAAEKGDKLAQEVIKETAFYLSLGVLSLIHTLDPELVIVGGKVSQIGERLFEPLRELVRKGNLNLEPDRLRIVPPELGDDAGIIGGASMVFGTLGMSEFKH